MSGLVDDAIKAKIVSIPKRPGPKPACTDAGPAHPGSARRSRFPGGSPPKLEPAGPERAAEGRSGSAGSAAPAPRSPTAGGYRRAAPQEPPSAAGRRAAPARAGEPGGRLRLGRCPWTRGPAHRPWAASVPAAVDERQVAHELLEGARAAPLGLLLDRGFRGHHWKLDISPAYASLAEAGIAVVFMPGRQERRSLSPPDFAIGLRRRRPGLCSTRLELDINRFCAVYVQFGAAYPDCGCDPGPYPAPAPACLIHIMRLRAILRHFLFTWSGGDGLFHLLWGGCCCGGSGLPAHRPGSGAGLGCEGRDDPACDLIRLPPTPAGLGWWLLRYGPGFGLGPPLRFRTLQEAQLRFGPLIGLWRRVRERDGADWLKRRLYTLQVAGNEVGPLFDAE
jgi:hypothetical protein